MSSPLTLDDHRCPGCGRVARVVDTFQRSPDGVVYERYDTGHRLACGHDGCPFIEYHGESDPTVRWWLANARPIGPGLGRLLVEAIETSNAAAQVYANQLSTFILQAEEPTGSTTIEPRRGGKPLGAADPPCLSPLIPPDLRGLAFQPEEVAALAAAAHGSADPEDPILEGLKEVVQTARMMRGRTFEPAYTPAPPPPSPDGDTYYRYRSVERSPDIRDAWVCWMVVRGDRMDLGDEFSAAIDPSGSGGYQGVPLSRWTAGEPLERTLHPVPRPEWAEGEGE